MVGLLVVRWVMVNGLPILPKLCLPSVVFDVECPSASSECRIFWISPPTQVFVVNLVRGFRQTPCRKHFI